MINFPTKCNITEECKQIIKSSLPQEWETDIREINASNDLEILIRINANTAEAIEKWVASYQRKTNTSYSVETTYKCSGQRVLFKKTYHCHHKTRHKNTYDPVFRKSVRNTNCPSIISIALRTIMKRYQGKDKNKAPDENKPCEIRLKLNHNHSTNNSMALRFKKVLPEVKEDLLKLFHQGHNAKTALEILKTNIRLNNENYIEIFNDRSRCPEYTYCHYLYQKTLPNLDENVKFDKEFLKNKIDEYNSLMNDTSAKMMVTNKNEFIICFCPPLIKRIHQFQPTSAEIVFIDSFPINDKSGSRIFILLTQSESGGLPLGVFITSSNNPFEIQSGLVLLKDLLDNVGFFCNVNGPQIFLTDENIAEYKIINSVWPTSRNLLSTFHVLQNIWKWLLNSRNSIEAVDRPVLFRDFYNLLYADSELELLEKFEVAKQNSHKYKHYSEHLDSYFDKKDLWALCYRSINAENCSNYSEIVMRVLRDKIFQRLIVFNLIQTVDFIINNFFTYFEQRLLYVAYNHKIKNVFYEKTQLPPDDIMNKIQILGTNIRLVPNEKVKGVFYMVNTDLLTCTCFNGYSNSICKHVQWVCMMIYSDEISKNIDNIDVRTKCYIIATGYDPPANLFENLREQTEENCDNSEVVLDILDVETFPNETNEEFYEEMCVDVESNNSMELNKYIMMKDKNDSVTNSTEKWKEVTKKIELLITINSKELLPALEIISNRIEKVTSVSELCSVFGIFDKSEEQKWFNRNKSQNFKSIITGRINKSENKRKNKKMSTNIQKA